MKDKDKEGLISWKGCRPCVVWDVWKKIKIKRCK
jgi:hypothetical protein